MEISGSRAGIRGTYYLKISIAPPGIPNLEFTITLLSNVGTKGDRAFISVTFEDNIVVWNQVRPSASYHLDCMYMCTSKDVLRAQGFLAVVEKILPKRNENSCWPKAMAEATQHISVKAERSKWRDHTRGGKRGDLAIRGTQQYIAVCAYSVLMSWQNNDNTLQELYSKLGLR